MAVYEKMSALADSRKADNTCLFNGYLEDYLAKNDNLPNKDLLERILTLDNEMKICVNYGFNVNRNVVSNQIIRYKDAAKLPEKGMKVPYVLYTKQEEAEKGFVLAEDYLFAKGFYFCLTEQLALLEDSRNELVALSWDNEALLLEKIEKFLRKGTKAGAVQREVDNYYFKNVSELVEVAKAKAIDIRDNALVDLVELSDKSDYIYSSVTKWYLLKKVVYVSYMMNKEILRTECENDIKKQRVNAKSASDSVTFIAYSEMWRMKKEEAEF